MPSFRKIDQDIIPNGDNVIALPSVVQLLVNGSSDRYLCRCLSVALGTPTELLAKWLPEGEKVDCKERIALRLLQDWRLRNGGNGTLEALVNILTQRYGEWEQALVGIRDKWLTDRELGSGSVVVIQEISVHCFPQHEIGTKASLGSRLFYGVIKNPLGDMIKHLAVKTWTAEFCRKVRQEDLALLQSQTNAGIWTNVNKIHYWGLVNNVYFLMSDIAMANLIDFIDKLQVRYHTEMITLCHDLVKGLDYLHKLGVTHGNIKPENVLMFETDCDKKWVAKLSDYGQQRSQCKDGTSFYDHLWIPPEALEQGQSLMVGDIFSLGKIIEFCFLSFLHWFKRECTLSPYVFEIMNQQQQCGGLPKVLFGQEAYHHLIVWMTQNEPQKRAKAGQVLLHPFFWTVEKSIHFLMDIAELWWTEKKGRKNMVKCWKKLDIAYVAFMESEKKVKDYSWYDRISCYPAFLERKFTDKSIPGLHIRKFVYNEESLFSLCELIRYTYRKHEIDNPYTRETFWVTQKNEPFCEKEFAQFWFPNYSSVPVALFCGLATFSREIWMSKLNEKYGVKEYFGMEGCWEDKVVGIICKYLGNIEEVELQRKRKKARNILDESSSSSEDEECHESVAEQEDSETLEEKRRRKSYIGALERRLPSKSDIPLVVPGTTITFFADDTHKIGSGRNCLVFRGNLDNGKSVAVKLFESVLGQDIELERVLEAWMELGGECKFVVNLWGWSREVRKKTTIYYVCMELMDLVRDESAQSLKAEILMTPPENQPEVALGYIAQIKEGLAFLHRNGLAHGNINLCSLYIFCDEESGEKVIKLGDLAKSRLEGNWLVDNFYGAKWAWVSPEVLLGEEGQRRLLACTKEADMFSFGMIMHSLLSSCQWHPFHVNGKGIIDNIINGKVKPRSLGLRNFADAENLVQWMMCKEPNCRPTAGEMVEHPLWWDSARTKEFLQNTAEIIGIEKSTKSKHFEKMDELMDFRKKIDESYQKYFKVMYDPTQEFNWKRELGLSAFFNDEDLDKNMDSLNFYDGGSLLNLVEFVVKQFKNQCQLAPMSYIRSEFLTDQHEFSEILYLNYILDKFPDLLILLFCVMHVHSESSPVKISQLKKCWRDECVKTFLEICEI